MKNLAKFMQTVEERLYEDLNRLAREKGITIQELLRAIIIPEWIKFQYAPRHGSGRRTRRFT